jgi:hypothetical protein
MSWITDMGRFLPHFIPDLKSPDFGSLSITEKGGETLL